MKRILSISLIFLITVFQINATIVNPESTQEYLLFEEYSLEFLENNDEYIKLSYEVADFYENTLSKIKITRALTPTELDLFYQLMTRLLKNDRERSYLELKLRVLSDLNFGKRFYEDGQARSLTLLWAATEMIGQNVFHSVFVPIYQNTKFRRMLLSEANDQGLKRTKVVQFFNKYFDNNRNKRISKFLNKFLNERPNFISLINSDQDQYLFEIIESLENKLNISNSSSLDRRISNVKFHLNDLTDLVTIKANNIFSELSGGFGNAVGKIKWRSGRLGRSAQAVDLVKTTLQPLDILVEKTPFILTDYLIPGHFGHIALYLGNETQLKEMNIWNHPKIVPYHQAIKSGKTILEAQRDGVELSTIDKFMNVDELAILRTRKSINHHHDEIYSRAMEQIGKAYDFNFDVETTDEIVCSELIYQTYYFINWNLEKTFGRWTISPDNIVQDIFQQNPQIDLVLYLKGHIGKVFKKLSKEDLQKVVGK